MVVGVDEEKKERKTETLADWRLKYRFPAVRIAIFILAITYCTSWSRLLC